MLNLEQIANYLWEAGNNSGHEPQTKGWWLALAGCAVDLSAENIVSQQLGGQTLSDRKVEATLPTPTPDIPTPTAPAVTPSGAEPDPSKSLPEDFGPRHAAERVGQSRRAHTNVSLPLTRDFRPSKFGYTLDDLRRDYPHVDPANILEQFFSHHIAKGDTSKNWLEKFFSFAANGERYAKNWLADKTSTDSMGQPLDPSARVARVRAARDHSTQNNEWIDQQIAAQEAAERESNHMNDTPTTTPATTGGEPA